MTIWNQNQTAAQARALIGAGRYRQAIAILQTLMKLLEQPASLV